MTGCEIRLSRPMRCEESFQVTIRHQWDPRGAWTHHARHTRPPENNIMGGHNALEKLARMGSSVGSWSWLTKVLKQKSKRGPRMNACPPNFPVRCFRFLWRSHSLNRAPSIVANARAVTRESVGSRRNNAKAWHLRVLNLLRDEFFFFSPLLLSSF